MEMEGSSAFGGASGPVGSSMNIAASSSSYENEWNKINA